MKEYSVLILGAGRIGAFFDTSESELVLTHAKAFTTHPGFCLMGFVDQDRQQALRAASIWGGGAFVSLAEALDGRMVDVAVVAAPDDCHYPLLKALADYPLRLVFAEKPLTATLAQAAEITELYRDRGIALALNYSRRYVPEFEALRAEIADRRLGRLLAGCGYYGKGTLHNGSHMIDLLRFLFGDCSLQSCIDGVHDYSSSDPSCSALLRLPGGGTFVMQAVDCRCYTIFELDLLFEWARIRLTDAGFEMQRYEVKESATFTGYFNLALADARPTGLGAAMGHAVGQLYAHLSSGAPLCCTGLDGLRAQQVAAAIVKGAL